MDTRAWVRVETTSGITTKRRFYEMDGENENQLCG